MSVNRHAIGLALSATVVLALLVVAGIDLLAPDMLATEYETVSMTYDISTQVGVLILVCAAMYAVPLTSFLGTVLLTGLAGGVILAHLRVGEIGATSQFFAAAVTVLAWLGLYLRRDDHIDVPSNDHDGPGSE